MLTPILVTKTKLAFRPLTAVESIVLADLQWFISHFPAVM